MISVKDKAQKTFHFATKQAVEKNQLTLNLDGEVKEQGLHSCAGFYMTTSYALARKAGISQETSFFIAGTVAIATRVSEAAVSSLYFPFSNN